MYNNVFYSHWSTVAEILILIHEFPLFSYLWLYSYTMLDTSDIHSISDLNENHTLFYVTTTF